MTTYTSDDTSRLSHNEFARVLIEEDHACIVGGALAVWDGRRYVPGNDAVDRAIIKHDDARKRKERGEIREYLRLLAPVTNPADPVKIAFENGVLDVTNGTLEQYSPKLVITNVIPHRYESDAYDEATDAFLNRVSCGDSTVRANLEEVIGLCMYRSNEIGVCVVLLGSGSNGKSVFLAAVRNAIGVENVSSLDLSMIGKRFQTGLLLGKLANIGDDIANGRISGELLSVFKKIVTGERVFADVKGSVGFEFEPYCKLIFSANEMPSLGDSSDGVMRRLFPIPFDATFNRNDEDFDPRMKEKVTSEQAARYLCMLGVKGLRRILQQHGMTPNARSVVMTEEIKIDSDPVIQWIQAEGIEAESLIGRPTRDVHEEYVQWCSETCSETYALRKFTGRINTHFGLKSDRKRVAYIDKSRVVQAFMEK